MIVTKDDGSFYEMHTTFQRIMHSKLAWNNIFYLDNGGRSRMTLSNQQNFRKELEDVWQPADPGLHFLVRTYIYDIKYFFPAIRGWHITTGINGMQQENKNEDIGFLIPDHKIFDGGVYGVAKKDWSSWSVSGGLRFN